MTTSKPLSSFQELRLGLLSGPNEHELCVNARREQLVDVFWRGLYPFKMYGVGNHKFDDLNLRISNRSAVETKMDHIAEGVAEAISEIMSNSDFEIKPSSFTVIDPFLGAGNFLFHMVHNLKIENKEQPENPFMCPVDGIGFEINEKIFNLTKHNFDILESNNNNDTPSIIQIYNKNGMEANIDVAIKKHVIITVDPPWITSEWETTGHMDLNKTDPPVNDIIRLWSSKLPLHASSNRLFFAILCPCRTTSIDELFTSGILLPLSYGELIPKGVRAGQQQLVFGVATESTD